MIVNLLNAVYIHKMTSSTYKHANIFINACLKVHGRIFIHLLLKFVFISVARSNWQKSTWCHKQPPPVCGWGTTISFPSPFGKEGGWGQGEQVLQRPQLQEQVCGWCVQRRWLWPLWVSFSLLIHREAQLSVSPELTFVFFLICQFSLERRRQKTKPHFTNHWVLLRKTGLCLKPTVSDDMQSHHMFLSFSHVCLVPLVSPSSSDPGF